MVLAAGGTGGHLFPAFALAEELTRRGIIVDLMTDERGEKYGTAFPGRDKHHVPSATIAGRDPIALAKAGTRLGGGTLKAWTLLGKLKPAVVVGFGGYPSFPPLVAARLRGIASAVHEQNAVMGRANRALAGRVSAIAASWADTKGVPEAALGTVTVTGNPVRQAVTDAARTPYVQSTGSAPFSLVVFGGSQGARFFSESMPPALAKLPDALRRRLRVTQQCRDEDLAQVRSAYAELGIAAELAPFFTNLPERMAAAQLVIARSGASSVAELAVLGRPSILVPLPHALDNDQLHNARRLADAGAALCLEQKDLSADRMAHDLAELMQAPGQLAAAAAAAKGEGRPDAVARLADLVVRLGGG